MASSSRNVERCLRSDRLSPLLAGPWRCKEEAQLGNGRCDLIVPDNLDPGRSGKPSDSPHGPLPRSSYCDMIEAQYRLLTDGLERSHLLG
jgi:homoserine O-acetyltransferase